ncbi:MAG: hypothetical protein IPM54_24005 [Polyangiaceae bacterium]|nr:hypothetical protein [Polyangiaceae bacterium]
MKRKRKSKHSANPWPAFMGWCPEDQRFEALASTMVALAGEEGICYVSPRNPRDIDDPDYVYVPQPDYFVPPREAIEVIRPEYQKYASIGAYINDFRASSGRVLQLHASTTRDRKLSILPGHPNLNVAFCDEPFVEGQLLPDKLMRFKGIVMKPGFDAAMAWLMALRDSLDILTRFCTSHPSITMGCCLEGPRWGAPLTGAASYHADGYPGRDLALSWIHLHDKDPLDLAVGWTIDALRERVEASPPNSSVWIVDEQRLSREQILAALDLPPKTLVGALETAANKLHPEWEAIQWKLAEYMKLLVKAPESDKEMIPVTEEHIHFIEEYTPAYVRHLDNKALVLHAHPDRTIWPLWADALALLGIR